MIAMPLTYPGVPMSQDLSQVLTPSPAPSTQPDCFQPLDSGIVSTSIPAFFIGRNRDGFWVARDARGENGGIFLFKRSALAFARRTAGPFGCATVFPTERFELDVENRGNRLIDHLKPLWRLVAFASRRSADSEA
jgi:hypothetical protein